MVHAPDSDGRVLSLPDQIRHQIICHAVERQPIEACGLLAGFSDQILAFHPVTNTAASAERFVLDGAEMLLVEQAANDAGHEIIGVMHSHTSTPAWPSQTDRADAARFDPFGAFHHLIVSTVSDPPDLRAFLLHDGDVVEVSFSDGKS